MRDMFETDYSHQSLNDIKNDLKDYIEIISEENNISQKYIDELGTDWENLGYDDFHVSACRCKKLLETALEDIKYVLSEIDEEIKENHVNILKRIGINGSNFNKEIGQAKGLGGRHLADGAEYELYCKLRDSMINLIDLSDLSNRLKDFVGKKKKHIPWGTIFSNFIAFLALIVSILAYLKG